MRHEESLKSFVLSSKIKVSQCSARVASVARLGTLLGSILRPFWLPDGSSLTSGALKTAPRRPGELPRHLLNGSRAAPEPPRTPPGPPPARPSASKSSPEEVLGTPSRLQELSRGAFQASGSWPAASSLFAAAEVYGPAGGLGGMREALTILRNSKQLLRTLKDSEFIRTTPKGSPSWGSWVLCKQSVEELSTRPATAVHTNTL